MTRLIPFIGLLAVIGSLAGCGYKAGGPWRSDIRTVYVDMVGSKEFRRDLEFTLTESIKKHIGTDTPYRLAPRKNADTILEAEILEERQAAYGPDLKSRQPREKTVTLSARVQWKDVRTGRILADQPQVTAVDLVVTPQPDSNPPIGVSEKSAQEQALDRLATKIVAMLYEDW